MFAKKYICLVKYHRKPIILLSVLIAGIFMLVSFILPAKSTGIEIYYTEKIKELKNQIAQFQQGNLNRESLSSLKTYFIQSRLSYKKMAVLSEYFNQYETAMLNGPALDRLIADTPDGIIPPEGFQAIEQLIYSDWTDTSYKKLENYLAGVQETLTRLENEPDKAYKFKDELVWDALRSSVLRIITLGITGFDSPIANLSLTEAQASIDGTKEVLLLVKKSGADEAAFGQLFSTIADASLYLKTNTNFNTFNRLVFITDFADPLYRQINQVRSLSNVGIPEGANPINFKANSIFDEGAFNINFFTPSNEYWVTKERTELGKKLFYDNILSGTKTRNCSSCHLPEKAFTDGLKTSLAIDNKTPLLRNSPTLLNAGFQTKFFYDSRVSILEGQLTAVIHNEEEMKGSLAENVADLKKIQPYIDLFKKAYPKEPEPLTAYTIINSISTYIRSLTSLDSRFDLYMRGNKNKLSNQERRGFNLFAGKAKCASCHFIPLFNGLVPPVFNETESDVLGVPATTSKKNARLDSDSGRYGFTRSVIHKYAFKTPTLRNIELTAPYMHNGVYTTLEEVMEFYNQGGGKGLNIAPPNQTLPFDKLNLTKKEIKDIIAFMKTLTDTSSVYKTIN
jgi:cytochrome c peroxidase